jgi:uncharacterized protein YjbJ (UPF0337 family)
LVSIRPEDVLPLEWVEHPRASNLKPEVKEMAEDRTKGALNKTKGVIKENVGKATGDRSTQAAGKVDQAKGKLQGKIGDAKTTIRNQENRNR